MSKWWNDTTDVILLKNPQEPIVIKWLVTSHFFVNRKIIAETTNAGRTPTSSCPLDWLVGWNNQPHAPGWLNGGKQKPPARFFKTRTPETAKNRGRVPQHHGNYVRERAPFHQQICEQIPRSDNFGDSVLVFGFVDFFPFGSFTTFFKKGAPIWFEIEKVQKRRNSIFTKKVEQIGKVS